MTAFAATARGELYMQLRKPAIWIATALPFALYALFAVLGSDSTGLQRYRYETSPKVKYLGVCAATAVPVALLYVAVALGFTVWRGQPAAPWWGLATFMVIVLPLLLLVGSLSFLGPQLMPLPLFRVLIVALFFWAVVTEVESEFPSFAGTVFSLTMDSPPSGCSSTRATPLPATPASRSTSYGRGRPPLPPRWRSP